MYKMRRGNETFVLTNPAHVAAFKHVGWELVAEEEKEVEATPEVHEEVPKKRTRRKKAE